MKNLHVHNQRNNPGINPHLLSFEVVERKFRGHPDSLADMVAQSFTQKYILTCWDIFPELMGRYFPNFSADKVVLSGASTKRIGNSYEVLKPIDALLIGKLTKKIGDREIDIDGIFANAIDCILTRSLGHEYYKQHIRRTEYSVSLAGVDHNNQFYQPESVIKLLAILEQETHANDTVFVVAYSPLSVAENLSVYLDNLTAASDFNSQFNEIGSDIKAMIRRRGSSFDITLCLPVFPEIIQGDEKYSQVINNAKEYIENKVATYLEQYSDIFSSPTVDIQVNTKDTPDKKYYAVWGTSLSKGDIGAVGRGNRQQGFISGTRPSTNEAMSGKNPNHFAGIIFQIAAEDISQQIYTEIQIPNVVYITANNGDKLHCPNAVDVLLGCENPSEFQSKISEIVSRSLESIPQLRTQHIHADPYERFMRQSLV